MTIAEVSKKYDITPDTLRYYERVGLLNNVPRNPNGIRNYDEQSCKRIELVKCMRNAGVEIEILIEYMSLFEQGKSTVKARKSLLEEQREKLLEKHPRNTKVEKGMNIVFTEDYNENQLVTSHDEIDKWIKEL